MQVDVHCRLSGVDDAIRGRGFTARERGSEEGEEARELDCLRASQEYI